MTAVSTDTLDHIVHLSPPSRLEEGIERFKSLGFNVIIGGTHADGLTYNAVVVLQDGVYLELIAFVHEIDYYPPGSGERRKRENHRWATKKSGWIDWALLGLDEHVGEIINHRSADESHTVYEAPQPGGRRTPEGRDLKWRVTVPSPAYSNQGLPFFCEDVNTPRKWRVPNTPSNVNHPSTAKGIAHIKFRVQTADELGLFAEHFTTVLGEAPSKRSLDLSEATWILHSLSPLKNRSINLTASVVDSKEDDDLSGGGENLRIWEVGFWVDADQEDDKPANEFGKIAWVKYNNK